MKPEMLRSEFNTAPEVQSTLEFPAEVYIVDSTIRSLQSGFSGSRHAVRDLVDIGVALDQLGVRELIVNLIWGGGLAICEGLAAAGVQAKIVGTFRARDPNAEQLARDGIAAGASEICFESAQDADHLGRLMDVVRSRDRLMSHAFAEVASLSEVVALCRAGVPLGVQSQSFHDSFFNFGLTPEGAKHFYRSVRSAVPQCPPMYIHLSNFFGHATMTAVAALAGGATAADASMNGIGHHCGHISLAEVVMVLEVLYGVKTGIRLDRLRDTSRLVRERTGVPLPMASPVAGDYAFMMDGAFWAEEAGLPYEERVHAKFPVSPVLVGNEERVVWSDRTITVESVRAKLRSMGVEDAVANGPAESIIVELRAVLQARTEYPCWLSDAEFERVCRRVLASRRKRGPARQARQANGRPLRRR